jgi:hypothetical protein
MRLFVCLCILVVLGSCKEEIYFIPGTGVLPACDEAPVADLNGTLWFDQGTVTIRTAGGNVLTVSPAEQTMTGTLSVQGRCAGDYAVTFRPVNDPSLN